MIYFYRQARKESCIVVPVGMKYRNWLYSVLGAGYLQKLGEDFVIIAGMKHLLQERSV